MNLRAPRYALLIAIAVCLLVWFALGGCATQRQVEYRYNACDGATRRVHVTEITTAAPVLECVALAARYNQSALWVALQLPIGCTFRRDSEAVIVLPLAFAGLVATHEYAHLAGSDHPPGLPFHTHHCGE